MKDIIIKIERKTSQVFLNKKVLGINGENLQGNIVFEFLDQFVDGIAWLELETKETKGYLLLTKENNTYKLPILSSLLAKKGYLTMQLRITESENVEGIPVFKSNEFYLEVKGAINSTETIEEQYPSWVDMVNEKINVIKTDGKGNKYLSDDGTYKYVEGGGSNGGGGDIDLSDYATKDEIPTKTSQLTNDSGFLTNYTEIDPTVPSHVKAITQDDINKWNNNSGGESARESDIFEGYDRFYDSIARMQVNPTEPLNIITYDGSNKPTHPKVLYFKDGWNGYKYWLTYTPFPGNNNTYENPCIAYSNDGINFISDGINNPIEDTPMENGTKVGYNSDAHIVLVDNVMECWWRTHYQSGSNANHEVIYRKKSTDGVNWSEKEELYRVQDASAGSCLSPTVIYEDGIYKIWCIYKQQVMKYYESETGSNWNYIRDINVDNPNYPNYKIWHIDVIHTSKGYEFVGCYHPTTDYNDNRYIYYAVSEDNITYSDRVLILTPGPTGNFDATELYRPSLVRLDNKVMVYYGCRNGFGDWRIGMIEAPSPYLFNAVLRNGLRFSEFESRISVLESGSGESVTKKYTIAYSLNNCKSSNGTTSITEGASYTTTLSVNTGYILGTPVITMGGANVTNTVWNANTKTITISAVTGNVSITCTASVDSSGGDNTGGDNTGEELTVANSFEESTWTSGYYNDDGILKTELNMHHSQLIPVNGMEGMGVKSSAQYLRISYFDVDKNYVGYDRGAGIGVGGTTASSEIEINTSVGAYFAVNGNSADKSKFMVSKLAASPNEVFETSATPIAAYFGNNSGDTENEWIEANGGNSIAMTGGTWADGILSLDGVDDMLTLPLNGAKSVTIRMKTYNDYAVTKKNAYIFDCRPTATVYLLNYDRIDYIGDGAKVYAGTKQFVPVATGFADNVSVEKWITYTIVFNSAYTGNMVIGAHNSGSSDFMKADIEEIKVYDMDITTG